MIRTVLLLISVGAVLGVGTAQPKFAYNAEAEKTFSTALREFSGRRFDEAVELFDALRKQRPLHQRTTASYCMASKAYFELKEYKLSYAVAQALLLEFPLSAYRADAEYLVALNALMFQKYAESLRYLIAASEHSSDSTLAAQVSLMITMVGGSRVSIVEKEAMYTRESAYYPRSFLALLIAEEYWRQGERARTDEFLRRIEIVDSTDALARRTAELRRKMLRSVRLRIGALLPRSDVTVKMVADEMLDGMEFALHEYAASFPLAPQLSLEVRDTDLPSQERRRSMTDLAEMSDVVAVIGPLFSNVAMELAPVAVRSNVPMISPTATADGIAQTGECIFQLHADFSTRGKAMARYAVQNLGFTKVAVLTSSDQNAKAVADAFVAEAERLGASVLANQTYGKDTTDLREPLIAIRQAAIEGDPRISFAGKVSKEFVTQLLRAGANPAVLSAAQRRNEAVEVTKLFGPNGVRIADSLNLPVIPPQSQPTALEIPATALDGLFVSISGAEELDVVAPQISYFNIRTQLMGSAEWNDPAALEANRRYVEDAVFIADTYIDREDSAYIEFENAFKRATAKVPTKNAILGYDAMHMVTGLIAGGAATRTALARELRSLDAYQGIHATVTLRGNRVNSSVQILKYHHGEIAKIREVATQ